MRQANRWRKMVLEAAAQIGAGEPEEAIVGLDALAKELLDAIREIQNQLAPLPEPEPRSVVLNSGATTWLDGDEIRQHYPDRKLSEPYAVATNTDDIRALHSLLPSEPESGNKYSVEEVREIARRVSHRAVQLNAQGENAYAALALTDLYPEFLASPSPIAATTERQEDWVVPADLYHHARRINILTGKLEVSSGTLNSMSYWVVNELPMQRSDYWRGRGEYSNAVAYMIDRWNAAHPGGPHA